jgi:hypothetical protein
MHLGWQTTQPPWERRPSGEKGHERAAHGDVESLRTAGSLDVGHLLLSLSRHRQLTLRTTRALMHAVEAEVIVLLPTLVSNALAERLHTRSARNESNGSWQSAVGSVSSRSPGGS